MKQILSALLSLTMLLTLAACGGQPAKVDSPQQEGVDLKGFYEDFLADMSHRNGPDHVPQMVEMDQKVLDAYLPGISSLDLKQCVAFTTAISGVAFEFDLVEAKTSEDAAKAAEVLQARIDYQVKDGAWYPATVEVWEQAQVVTHGSYAGLIAAGPEQENAVAAFNALFA